MLRKTCLAVQPHWSVYAKKHFIDLFLTLDEIIFTQTESNNYFKARENKKIEEKRKTELLIAEPQDAQEMW